MKFGFRPHIGGALTSNEQPQHDKAAEAGVAPSAPHDLHDSSSEVDSEKISENAQYGVQKIEATTKVWNKTSLTLAYIFIWVIYFVDAMQQSSTSSMLPYVTSSFSEHSLTATTSVMSSLIGGLFQLPLAKILDIWGRPQGFAITMSLLVLGLIMMAACQNVQTYAAAQVFYWVGYNGMNYTLSVFIADTSSLRNRGLMYAFVSSPYIVTVWIGGPLATSFLGGPGFRWAFGVFAIITPIMTIPLWSIFYLNYRKAKKAGLLPQRNSGRTVLQSISYYFVQFDIIGLLILVAGLALFLIPFNIYSKQAEGWKSPMIICMIVFGFLLCVGFAIWEKFFAPVQFIPYSLLTDRTVLGSCILAAVLFVEFYIWDNYFTSFLQVVNGLTITHASYVANIYSIGSCFWALVVGAVIRWTGRFKWPALYFGVPITILGVGLMVAFRQPDVNVGYIVMCQIFIAVGGGTLVICEQIAVMAPTDHQHIAVVLAIQAMFSAIGGAIGSSVAAGIWTGVFPTELAKHLPAEAQANLTSIYGDLTVQLSYPMGSPTRDAIIKAYGVAQKDMLIAATAVLAIAVVAVVVWRDIHVKSFKQTKGLVV